MTDYGHSSNQYDKQVEEYKQFSREQLFKVVKHIERNVDWHKVDKVVYELVVAYIRSVQAVVAGERSSVDGELLGKLRKLGQFYLVDMAFPYGVDKEIVEHEVGKDGVFREHREPNTIGLAIQRGEFEWQMENYFVIQCACDMVAHDKDTLFTEWTKRYGTHLVDE